ncbi:MAG: glycosyltransferase family 2 protein [Pseudobdellovibrio sp.]
MNLSVVVVCLNEEANIERCLNSVQWADEILVYDSGSTDKTIVIAQSLGAKIVSGEWFGFGPTKNKAVSLAKHDWILSVDADEEVCHNLAFEIQNSALVSEVAYKIPRLSRYLNHWVRYGGWYPDYQIRLFHRKFSQWNQNLIHEKVEAAKYQKLARPLFHYVFKNIEHHVQTNNKYSTLLAKKMWDSGYRFSWFQFLTKPWVKFIECYILKLGFLDGWVGFLIARSASYSVLLKWSKLKELGMKA